MNAPLAWRIRGACDASALATALRELTTRHEILRTTYVTEGRRLLQRVHAPAEVPLRHLGHQPADAALAALQAYSQRQLDAAQWPTSAALWHTGAEEHLLLLNIHHLATDFFSNAVIARDLVSLYRRAVGAQSEPLPAIGWQYLDWSERQREEFAAGRLERLQRYWGEYLLGAELPRLEAGEPGGSGDGGEPAKVTLDLAPDLVAALAARAMALRTTLFPLMLAAFFAHLHARTGQDDLAIASLLTNRGRPQVQQTAGFFVNMIALRGRAPGPGGFDELVRATRSAVLGALSHADLPYQLLPARTVRGHGSARVDDIVFQYLETPATAPPSSPPHFEPVELTVAAGRFALELVVHDQSQLMVRYDPRRFSAAWARDFLDGYAEALWRARAAVTASGSECTPRRLISGERAGSPASSISS